MRFSKRTEWHSKPNELTELLNSLRRSGKPVTDLTLSNPTGCGLDYSGAELLQFLSLPESLRYDPDPRGIISARESVASYYRQKKVAADPNNIFLTSSTSEAYSQLFRLLCDPGDIVLVPRPSYPLFDYLAQLNDVTLRHYELRYDGEWRLDLNSLDDLTSGASPGMAGGKIRAIVIVNPHNPTGMFLKKEEYLAIKEISLRHDIAIIVDEVFIDYSFGDDESRIGSTVGENQALTFTLNGISKMIGLPQMKLGWIAVGGEPGRVTSATSRLEIICDTFLSVNTPVQNALPFLLENGRKIQGLILDRVRSNYSFLSKMPDNSSPCTPLRSDGGWYGIMRMPRIRSDERWALGLLEKEGINLFPGYFFDFPDEGYLVLSLLPDPPSFQRAVSKIVEFASRAAAY